MSKMLFSDDRAQVSVEQVTAEDDIDVLDPSEMTEDLESSLSLAQEATQTAFERAQTLRGMGDLISSKKPCTESYFTSLSCLKEMTETWSDRMGVRGLPAMEDYSNRFSANASHEIAMEGIKDFVKKTWEKIVRFFKDFFKKVGVFFKRLLRMELDLASYEKYTEALIAKLKARKGEIKVTAPFASRLPSLLAHPGMENIDSDFVLNQGTMKIARLIQVIQKVGFTKGGPFDKAGDFDKLEGLISGLSSLRQIDRLSNDIVAAQVRNIKDVCFAMMSGIFRHPVTSEQQLPQTAYLRINENYISAEGRENLLLKSISEVRGDMDSLPAGANVFLGHIAEQNYYVCGGLDKDTAVSNMIAPVAKLESLESLYGFYKSNVKTFTMKDTSRVIQDLDKRVGKLLELIQRYVVIVPVGGDSFEGVTVSDVEELMTKYKASGSESIDKIVERLTQMGQGDSAETYMPDNLHNDIILILNASNKGEAFKIFKAKGQGKISQLFKLLLQREGATDGLGESEDTTTQLNDLNKYLSNFLTRLQSLFKEVMTNFYNTLTDVRFELLKYIYNSAKLYSY